MSWFNRQVSAKEVRTFLECKDDRLPPSYYNFEIIGLLAKIREKEYLFFTRKCRCRCYRYRYYIDTDAIDIDI